MSKTPPTDDELRKKIDFYMRWKGDTRAHKVDAVIRLIRSATPSSNDTTYQQGYDDCLKEHGAIFTDAGKKPLEAPATEVERAAELIDLTGQTSAARIDELQYLEHARESAIGPDKFISEYITKRLAKVSASSAGATEQGKG